MRDWRFRSEKWQRRARFVAREFRDGDASTSAPVSPTTPLALVKMLMVLGLLHDLSVASTDVADTFLQVHQQRC